MNLEQEHHDRCATHIDHALRCTCEREEAYDEPNNYMLCPKCQVSHHEDEKHTCNEQLNQKAGGAK